MRLKLVLITLLFPLTAHAQTAYERIYGEPFGGGSHDRDDANVIILENTERNGDANADFHQYQVERSERDPNYRNSLNSQLDQQLHGLSQFQDDLRRREQLKALGR